MERAFMKNQKGQATVEFILLVVLALVYITTIVQPAAELSTKSVEDISGLAKLKVSVQKLANAIEYVGISGTGTKETIQLIVPENGKISCASGAVRYSFELNSGEGIVACENDEDVAGSPDSEKTCSSSVKVNSAFSCAPGELSKGAYTATISKISGSSVSVAFG